MNNHEPPKGVWLSTRVLNLQVVVEYRQSSSMIGSERFYNELSVWLVTPAGTYDRCEHMETLPTRPVKAAERHSEIVEKIAAGRSIVEHEEE